MTTSTGIATRQANDRPAALTTSGAMPILPIMPNMTLTAEANQVARSVGCEISGHAESPKRLFVCNRELLTQILLPHTALLALVLVALAGFVSLYSPVGSVVANAPSYPVWAIFATECTREPFQPTRVAAKSFRRFAGPYHAQHATRLTAVRHPAPLAFLRAVAKDAPRWRHEEVFAATLALLPNPGFLGRARPRAKALARMDRGIRFGASLASFVRSAATDHGAIDATIGVRWKDTKMLATPLASFLYGHGVCYHRDGLNVNRVWFRLLDLERQA